MREEHMDMQKEELKTAFECVIDRERAPRYLIDCLLAEVSKNIGEIIDGLRLPALDRSVIEEGGMAFLWEDVLAVGDAFDTFGELIDAISPAEAARLLVRLALTWRRLRGVRVRLNEKEFKILTSVKKGAKSVKEVSMATGYLPEEVSTAVNNLRKREYRSAAYLLEGKDGCLSTKF